MKDITNKGGPFNLLIITQIIKGNLYLSVVMEGDGCSNGTNQTKPKAKLSACKAERGKPCWKSASIDSLLHTGEGNSSTR